MLSIEGYNIFRKINRDLSEEDIKMMNPLSLAYIGDAVFEMFIRTEILKNGKLNSHKLHIESSKRVNNKAQANFLLKIMENLSDQEVGVVNRAKNSKNHTIPKNADVHDYKLATALEALFGFHYLLGNEDRLEELYYLGVK